MTVFRRRPALQSLPAFHLRTAFQADPRVIDAPALRVSLSGCSGYRAMGHAGTCARSGPIERVLRPGRFEIKTVTFFLKPLFRKVRP